MGIGLSAPYFRSRRKQTLIFPLHNIYRFQGFGEAGPASARIEFIERTEKRLTGNNIYINAFAGIVIVFILKRWFRAVFLSYFILYFSKLFFQRCILGLVILWFIRRFNGQINAP